MKIFPRQYRGGFSGPPLIKIVSAFSIYFKYSYNICVYFCNRANQTLTGFSSTKFALHLTLGQSGCKFNYVYTCLQQIRTCIMQSRTIYTYAKLFVKFATKLASFENL